ncbi:MAG: DnaJ C-terminal domain-containing protein [Cyanobacteriota bacterium]
MAKNKPKDYYKILDISPKASDKEIKHAYRSLARKYHPDVNQGNIESEKRFKEISEAYSILSDDKQRYLLDIALGIKTIEKQPYIKKQPPPKTKAQSSPNTSTNKKTSTGKTGSSNKDSGIADAFSTLFDNIMKNAENIKQDKNTKTPQFTTEPPPKKNDKPTYSDIGVKPRKARASMRGEDITLEIYLTSSEAIKGTIRTINIVHTDPCLKCKSIGMLAGRSCQYCEGRGEKTTYKKLDVKIPAGIKNGSKVRISKEGNIGKSEDDRGDLYLIIKLYNPTNFEFDGNNVLSELVLAPHEAVLGCEVQILTVDGFLKMKIPAATQSNQKFRLVGQGLPDKNGERGNHFVKIKIEVPEKLSEKERELYEEIAKISKFNPREYIE